MSAQRIEPPAAESAGWTHPVRAGFEAMIAQGPVMLAVSSAFEGVAPILTRAAGPHVCLRFGRNLSPQIVDMAWDDAQLIGTLSFFGQPFACRIPWAAIVAIKLDGPRSVPAPVAPKSPRGAHLKLVP